MPSILQISIMANTITDRTLRVIGLRHKATLRLVVARPPLLAAYSHRMLPVRVRSVVRASERHLTAPALLRRLVSPAPPSSHAPPARLVRIDSTKPFSRSYSAPAAQTQPWHARRFNLRFALLLPVLLGVGGSSTLWLEAEAGKDRGTGGENGAGRDGGSGSVNGGGSGGEHSLKTILDNVEKPDADEFLIAADANDDPEDDGVDSASRRGLRVVHSARRLLRDYLVEPLSTSLRFFQLAVIFLPVLLSAPILFLELVDDSRDRRRGHPPRTKERRTTRWWYYLLVHQMELAGPTFIKVRLRAGVHRE